MRLEVLETTDNRWAECLEGLSHDIYHLAEYVAADDLATGTTTKLFVVSAGGNRLVVPLTIRPVPGAGHLLDATSPYGYPAPTCTEGTESHWSHQAMLLLLDHLRDSNVVSVFLRLHPLMGLPASALERYGTRVDHGSTVSIELGRPFADIRSGMRKSHRYEIRKGLREGQKPELDGNWSHFEDFIDIYTKTMRRLGASSSYYFSRDYFIHLRDQLADNVFLWVTKIDGEVAAAALITECSEIVQYHLSGTHPEFHHRYPTKVLLDEVANWANDRGNSRFHLGGGLSGKEDSLFQFKAGFSKDRHTFSTVRVITLPEQYDHLTMKWASASGLSADNPSGFFPAYRKPFSNPT